MTISSLSDGEIKSKVAATILSYYGDAGALTYDSARKEFSVLRLKSLLEYRMLNEALEALGAKNANQLEESLVVTKIQGGKTVAENAKRLSLRFKGESDVPNRFNTPS